MILKRFCPWKTHLTIGTLSMADGSTKQLPDELEERIWWCVFLAALPLVYQDSTVCMLLVEIGLEKVRRESLRLGVSLPC